MHFFVFLNLNEINSHTDTIISGFMSNSWCFQNFANDRTTFRCDSCPRSYKYKHNLNRHQILECGKEPQFSCSMCPKKYKRKDVLVKHLLLSHSAISS